MIRKTEQIVHIADDINGVEFWIFIVIGFLFQKYEYNNKKYISKNESKNNMN